MLAFSVLEVASDVPSVKLGIDVVDLLRSLMAFQNCLVFEGSMFAKKDILASLRRDTTLFLSFLYLEDKWVLLVNFALLKAVFRLRISWMILLFS